MKKVSTEIILILVGVVFIGVGMMTLNHTQSQSNVFSTSDSEQNSSNSLTTNTNVSKRPLAKNPSPSKTRKPSLFSQDRRVPSLGRVKYLRKCLKSSRCKFPKTDPRSYSISVYKEITRVVKSESKTWQRDWENYTFSDQQEIINLISLQSGHVKAAVLDLMKGIPYLDAQSQYSLIVEHVLKFHDSSLIDESMTFLTDIVNPGNEVEIAYDLAGVIQNGSPQVSKAVARHALTFFTPSTKQIFAEVASMLPSNSPEVVYLNAAITEFEMTEAGG